MESIVRSAIANRDIKQMYELKDICDHIHSTGLNYKGYTREDLIEDELYEEMIRKINELSKKTTQVFKKGVNENGGYIRKDSNLKSIEGITKLKRTREIKTVDDLWMGSVIKIQKVPDFDEDVILLPKFDGCSCCVRLVRDDLSKSFALDVATTRGTEIGFDLERSNLTHKIVDLISDLITKMSKHDFYNVTIRGEIVRKHKNINAPASWVAGKINGGDKVWKDAVDELVYIPFEITRINSSTNYPFIDGGYIDVEKNIVPTQIESCDILSIDYPYDILMNPTLKDIMDFFDELQHNIDNPIDGVVYCPISWTYPTTKERTQPKQYGKYAWKPSSEGTSILTDVEYSISKEGRIELKFEYEPVMINGKNYKHAKCAINSYFEKIEGISFGDIVIIKLCGDISPYIASFEKNYNTTPFNLPKKCPFCNNDTEIVTKNKKKMLFCTNKNCRGILSQCMLMFLSSMQIKGIADKTLSKEKNITLETIDHNYICNKYDLIEIFKNKTINNLLIGLGFTKSEINKIDLNCIDTIYNNIEIAREKILSIPSKHNQAFIKSTLDYIVKLVNESKKIH